MGCTAWEVDCRANSWVVDLKHLSAGKSVIKGRFPNLRKHGEYVEELVVVQTPERLLGDVVNVAPGAQ